MVPLGAFSSCWTPRPAVIHCASRAFKGDARWCRSGRPCLRSQASTFRFRGADEEQTRRGASSPQPSAESDRLSLCRCRRSGGGRCGRYVTRHRVRIFELRNLALEHCACAVSSPTSLLERVFDEVVENERTGDGNQSPAPSIRPTSIGEWSSCSASASTVTFALSPLPATKTTQRPPSGVGWRARRAAGSWLNAFTTLARDSGAATMSDAVRRAPGRHAIGVGRIDHRLAGLVRAHRHQRLDRDERES